MSDYNKDYHVEIDEKIKQLSLSQEYKITGKPLVRQIRDRLSQIGIQLTNDEEFVNVDLNLEKISIRNTRQNRQIRVVRNHQKTLDS
jgi:hypothetical protein